MREDIIETIRTLVREMIEEELDEEELDEFSGAGGGMGMILPMGRSPNRQDEGLVENAGGVAGGFRSFTFHNHFRYPAMDDSYHDEERFYYFDGVRCLADSFGGSENPFGKGKKGEKKAIEYLAGKIIYPHKV